MIGVRITSTSWIGDFMNFMNPRPARARLCETVCAKVIRPVSSTVGAATGAAMVWALMTGSSREMPYR